MNSFSRRRFIRSSAALAALTSTAIPNLSFAAAPTDNRLVVMILRGALDSLHALPAHGDRLYYSHRPKIAVPKPGNAGGASDLNGYFGLHPRLGKLLPLYKAGDIVFLPAISTAYRERSHFDGQAVLESGGLQKGSTQTGWLNRALADWNDDRGPRGLALGKNIPLLLRGRSDVMSWAEDNLPDLEEDFLMDMEGVFSKDPLFSKNFALGREKFFEVPTQMMASGKNMRSLNNFIQGAQAAGMILAQEKSMRIAVVDMLGYDTHFGQNRRMNLLLDTLADGILKVKAHLAEHWDKTTIMVISEFGRTVVENGSQGTDHGLGGLSMLIGGAVRGGQIYGDWPGLTGKSLHEGRDLQAALSYESLFKTILISHLGLKQSFVEDQVFPDTRELDPLEGLF